MIRRAFLVLRDHNIELSPDAAVIQALVREVLHRHEVLSAELIARGVCPERACELIDAAAMGDPS